jgi:hypothetical protein
MTKSGPLWAICDPSDTALMTVNELPLHQRMSAVSGIDLSGLVAQNSARAAEAVRKSNTKVVSFSRTQLSSRIGARIVASWEIRPPERRLSTPSAAALAPRAATSPRRKEA